MTAKLVSISDAAPSRPLSRFAALRHEIASPNLSFLMEAHNGLSAKIVEEAGFKGIWASGLTMSAALGLRDSNEASWTQVLDVLEFMADSTTLPILVDGDTGYGNFNNVRRLVRKLCERRIAGVCIEDKLFPKTNSFIGENQPLAEIDEFCGRIKAGKDSQTDDDFVLLARVEALISGRGMDEALRRAEAYHAAGADGILIHSKKNTGDEILNFCQRWANRAPVIIVPTMYYATPTDHFRKAGISAIIWANHLLRSSIAAMRETARTIHDEESLMAIEGRTASVKDIFDLVGNAELEEAEKRYLPNKPRPKAVILAASGSSLGELTRDRPKCMVDIRGQSLLRRLTNTLKECGAGEIAVVRGYKKDAVNLKGIKTIDNDRYADTGELFSLSQARACLSGEAIISYGDILFRRFILDGLMASDADMVLAVDASDVVKAAAQTRDLVMADRPFSNKYLDDTSAKLVGVSSDIKAEDAQGEWMGLARLSAKGSQWLLDEMTEMEKEGLLEKADLPMLFTRVAKKHPVSVEYFTGHWMDVDDLRDLADARNFT